MERGRVRIVDENEQELIYRDISARNELLAGKNRVVDKIIDAEVLRSLKKDKTKASINARGCARYFFQKTRLFHE